MVETTGITLDDKGQYKMQMYRISRPIKRKCVQAKPSCTKELQIPSDQNKVCSGEAVFHILITCPRSQFAVVQLLAPPACYCCHRITHCPRSRSLSLNRSLPPAAIAVIESLAAPAAIAAIESLTAPGRDRCH